MLWFLLEPGEHDHAGRKKGSVTRVGRVAQSRVPSARDERAERGGPVASRVKGA